MLLPILALAEISDYDIDAIKEYAHSWDHYYDEANANMLLNETVVNYDQVKWFVIYGV